MGERTYVRFVRSEAELADTSRELPAVYLHWGGDAKFFREVMNEFFEAVERDCERPADFRYSDPSYLAAKFIVHISAEFADDEERRLSFRSVGVVSIRLVDAAAEGAWTYGVICSGRPSSPLRPNVITDEVLVTETKELAYHSLVTLDEAIEAQRKNEEEEANAELVQQPTGD